MQESGSPQPFGEQSAPPIPMPTGQMVQSPQAIFEGPNDSGTPGAVLPTELKGYHWGAFFFTWVWALGTSFWLGILIVPFMALLFFLCTMMPFMFLFFPIIGLFMRMYYGSNGSLWAWRSRRWISYENFRNTRRTWGVVGLVLCIFYIPIIAAILFPVFARARLNAQRAAARTQTMQAR